MRNRNEIESEVRTGQMNTYGYETALNQKIIIELLLDIREILKRNL